MKLLLALWLFSRVLTDCHGGAEEIDHYTILATHLRVTHGATCTDDQGLVVLCDGTVLADPIPFRDLYDDGTGTDVVIPEDYVAMPELLPACTEPTCVTAWPWRDPVVAVDINGNRSTDPCP